MFDLPLVELVVFFLRNIPMEMLILSVIIGVIQMPSLEQKHAIEFALKLLLFLTVGVTGIWAFITHTFFPNFINPFVDGATNPLEFDVALANLALGITGLLAWWQPFAFRLSVVISVSCLLWGAAAAHLYQMFYLGDLALANAGATFYTNIAIPALLWLAVITRAR